MVHGLVACLLLELCDILRKLIYLVRFVCLSLSGSPVHSLHLKSALSRIIEYGKSIPTFLSTITPFPLGDQLQSTPFPAHLHIFDIQDENLWKNAIHSS